MLENSCFYILPLDLPEQLPEGGGGEEKKLASWNEFQNYVRSDSKID